MSARTDEAQSSYRSLILDLNSATCSHCAGTKSVRTSFCRACYLRLPPSMRNDLYKPIGDGYAEAKQAASDYLAQHRG